MVRFFKKTNVNTAIGSALSPFSQKMSYEKDTKDHIDQHAKQKEVWNQDKRGISHSSNRQESHGEICKN
jgi:hypothetical protein